MQFCSLLAMGTDLLQRFEKAQGELLFGFRKRPRHAQQRLVDLFLEGGGFDK